MLVRREDLRDRLIALVGRGRLTLTTKALDEAGERISRYLVMQVIVNGSFGIAVGIGLFFIGIPYALLWGFLAATLRYIPFLGPWLAALLPLGLSLMIYESWTPPLLVVGLFLILELSSNMFMEPWLYGRGIGVSAAASLVMIAFWTWLWGPIGLILATPLTVCLVVLGRYVPFLKFFDTLLGDQPALETHIGYYQRLLARDQDEAADIAEDYVKSHSLEEVFDELLIPALTYAKDDVASETLSADDQQFVFAATRDIVEQLATLQRQVVAAVTENAEAPQAKVLILGCPSRDKSDEVALLMLKEVLDPNRCETALTTSDILSTEVVGMVEDMKPAAICIAAIPPGGLAHSRLICLRLRARFPELKIVIGRWGLRGSLDKNREQLMAAGADQFGTTLVETRNQIMSIVQLAAYSQT
jgi:hypothetical protein